MPGAGDDPSNPLTASETRMTTVEKFAVPIVFTIFVTFRAADRVFMKAINNALASPAYNTIFSNVIWPFAMQFITLGMVSIYVMNQRRQGKKQYDCTFFLLGNKNASSMGAIPTYVLGLFTLGDQLNAALSAPCSAFISQPTQSILTNLVLVWIAIIAFFWIKTRFKAVHYVGIGLIFVSAFVQFAPYILHNKCDWGPGVTHLKTDDPVNCFSAYKSVLGEYIKMTTGQMAFFYLLYVVSTVPTAVSNVYKQKVLQGMDADIFYLTWWGGWFQVLWGYLCIPMIWIQLPGQPYVKPSQTFEVIGQTMECIGGHDPDGHNPGCEAQQIPPWVYMILYFAFNATFNLCITWLTKRISAMWVQVANVLCLNLCNIFNSWKLLMGTSAEPMTAWDWAAAIIASIALYVYSLQPEIIADAKDQQAVGSLLEDGHANEKLADATPNGSNASSVKPGSFAGMESNK